VRHESAKLSEELNHSEELYEHTKSELRRHRIRLDQQQQENDSQARRTKVLSIILGLMIVSLIASVWYSYPVIQSQKANVAELFTVKNVTDMMGERVSAVEARLNDATVGLPALMDRMDQLQTGMKSNLQAARSQAVAAATQMGQRIREEFRESIQNVQTRVAGVESNQREAHESVAQLKAEVERLQRELTAVQAQASASLETVKQLQGEQQASAAEISGLGKRMSSSEAAVGALNNQVNRQRVDFQVPVKGSEQVAPGIIVTIQKSDVKKQQIDGTLKIVADGRTLPLRELIVQKPITFYTTGEERPIELVFTEVSRNGVSGYVLMPSAGSSAF
jgi:chromosome segregation ATPase